MLGRRDGGEATFTKIGSSSEVAVAASGDVYFTSVKSSSILKVTKNTCLITTVTGLPSDLAPDVPSEGMARNSYVNDGDN